MCMLLTVGAAMAQKRFTFGPKVGFDITHLWGEGASHGVKAGYQAGLFMEYRCTSQFAIAPEVVFAAQGGTQDKTTRHLNYINVPVMFKFYVAPAFSIDLGPQVGFNVYSKMSNSGVPLDFKKDTKDIDFGVGLGATYNITNDVFVQARYTMGMTKVYEYQKGKNGNAQIAIGYRF